MLKLYILGFIAFIGFVSFIKNDTTGIKTKAQLGQKLFNEKILSLDSSVSCASCHNPKFAFADTAAFSSGIHNTPTLRNTPSVLNMLNRDAFFYDGRAKTLEQQALMPIENKNEMGLPITTAVIRLNANSEYKKLFEKIFKEAPTANNLAQAIAAYERTLETVDSKFDDWTNNVRKKWTASEERGRALFVGDKAKCFNCHMAEDFTNDGFKNIGTYNGTNLNDVGLFNITKKESDKGKFKTPGLRNIAVTAPYMHNGMFKTLEEVVAFYNDPKAIVPTAINIDADLAKPLGLTTYEQKDLVAFLKTLTDRKFMR
jgi:cytochrome c peroxidase